MKDKSARRKDISLPVIIVGIVILVVVIAFIALTSKSQGKTDTQSSSATPTQSTAKTQQAASASSMADKASADSIIVTSTGYSYYSGQYHYGFTVNNSTDFSGNITVILTNADKSYSNDSLVFTEEALKANQGDVGHYLCRQR